MYKKERNSWKQRCITEDMYPNLEFRIQIGRSMPQVHQKGN